MKQLRTTSSTSFTQSLARGSAHHPWRVLAAWGLVLVASVVAIGSLIGTAFTADATLTTEPESTKAAQVLAANFNQGDRIDEAVIIHSTKLTADTPQFKAFVADVRSSIEDTGTTQTVRDPYSPHQPAISEDGHAAVVTVVLGHDSETGIEKVLDEVVAADSASSFDVDITGGNTLGHDFNELSESDLTNGELKFGLPAAMIVLLLVFGALVAAFIPMGIAIGSIIVTVAISSVLGQFTSISFFIVNMITAMGLALGIDYSLFVLSRYREERQNGRDKIDAILTTGGTSSKAVLFSGTSFVIALLGLLLVPDTILRSLALGAIIVGLVTMAAALTLLPALLSILGDRVNALRLPIVGREHPAESPFWTKAVGAVVRRPAAALTVGVLILLAAAYPVLGLRTGNSGAESLPADTFAGAGAQALERSFPGMSATEPAQVVISGEVTAGDIKAAIARLEAAVADDPDFGPSQLQVSENGQVALVSIPLIGPPDHTQARRGLDRLRTDLIPAAFDGTATSVLVGGATAESVDYSDVINRWLPIVLTFVLGAQLPAADPRLPFRGHLRHRRHPQPPLGRCGLRATRAGLPARGRRRLARPPAGRTRRGLGARLLVLGALRALDGLPRLPAQPDQRALHPDRRHPRGRGARHRRNGTPHHRRCPDHRGRLHRVRRRPARHVPTDGLRSRRRSAGRRHPHPDGRRTRRDDASGPLELVPAHLAELAARAPRRRRPRTRPARGRSAPARRTTTRLGPRDGRKHAAGRGISMNRGDSPESLEPSVRVPSARSPEGPDDDQVEVVVVGAGQAGLAIGFFLARQGRRFLILEAADSVGAAWRDRWDSLALFTPRRYDALSELGFPGDPDGYPTRDEVVSYLRAYAETYELPVVLNSAVRSLTQIDDGFQLECSDRTVRADQVVVATGPFQLPFTPALAGQLGPEVFQMHSTGYRQPRDIPAGTVLVVGGGNTGFQIAAELAGTHTVHLSVGSRQTPLPQKSLAPRLVLVAHQDRVAQDDRRLTSRAPAERAGDTHRLKPKAAPASRCRPASEGGQRVEQHRELR